MMDPARGPGGESFFDRSPVGLACLSPDGHWLTANPALCEMLGYTREEMSRACWADLVAPDDRDTAAAAFRGLVEGDGEVAECGQRFVRKDSRVIEIGATLRLVRDAGGRANHVVAVLQDLTARRQAKRALLARSEDLDRFFDVATDMLCIIDMDGFFRRVNTEWERALGWTRAEMEGRRFLDFVHEDDLEGTRRVWSALVPGGIVRDVVNRYLCKDGSWRWLEWRSVPMGSLIYSAVRDISEHRRAEEALLESERLLRQVLDLVPHFIFAKDENSRFLLVNQAVAEAYGTQVADLVGKSDIDFSATPEEAQHFHEDDLAVIRSDRPKVIPEETITDATGRTRILETIKIPFRFGSARKPALLGVATNITERKRAETALLESERRFREMLESVHLAAVMYDCEGRITFANNQLARLSGWSVEELLGRDWFDTFLPEDTRERERASTLAALRSGDLDSHFERSIMNRRGELREVVWDATFLRDPGGAVTGVAKLGRDVTEIRKLEEQYRQSQKLEAIGQLAGGVAHDFNNLLQVIAGQVDLVMNDLKPGEPPWNEMNQIAQAASRATDLVRRLLTFSRRETMRCRNLNLDVAIAETTDMLRRVIGEHIKLEACYDGHLPQVYVDPGHLEQVLVNLCVNARDAMQAGGSIRIETSVRRFDAEFVASNPWSREGEFVLVSVADTGAGMPPDVLEHIFEPFFTTKEIGRGTGLGLAIVYGIVNQHGGLIQVESHEGKGSTFRIYLPAVREGASEIEEADHPPPSASLGSETILVAEDEELVRDLVVRILRRAGYRVHVARDGEEALEIFAREWKDLALVILDVVMPRLGGRAAWEAMKATNPHVRVLFSTGYDFDTLEMSESAGARASVIQKPFSPATLLSKVRTLIDTKEKEGSELH